MSRTVQFVISQAFTEERAGILDDGRFENVTTKLALRPELGDMIPKTGGARKLRQAGMRGQARVIYYYHRGNNTVYFLACYSKNDTSDLSEKLKAEIKEVVKTIKSKLEG